MCLDECWAADTGQQGAPTESVTSDCKQNCGPSAACVSWALAYNTSPAPPRPHPLTCQTEPHHLLPYSPSRLCPPLILASFHLPHLTRSKPSIRSRQHSRSLLLCGPFTSSKIPLPSPRSPPALLITRPSKDIWRNPSRLFVCLAPFYTHLPKNEKERRRKGTDRRATE